MNRGEEIGSMRRCVHYKNSYQTAIRLTFSITVLLDILDALHVLF
jgi:hypothetical protein